MGARTHSETHQNDLSIVPNGWTARAWAELLRSRATACVDVNPVRAKELRDAATLVDAKADREEALFAPTFDDAYLCDLITCPPDVPSIPRY